MSKLKVVTIVGTRPEIIRLSRLIPKLDEYTNNVLVHTGQNSDPQLNEVFFKDLDLRQPDYHLNVDTSSMGSVMSDVIRKSEQVFASEKPDAVLILGDTNSAIAAVVAERMHIPVYHMEAGNRSFDANVPEELNRKMVDHVASFNLPYNDYAMRNLLAEGIHPRFILKSGSPMREVIEHYRDKIESSTALDDRQLEPHQYFLVSVHRQENVDDPERLRSIVDALLAVSEAYGQKVLVSTHPRTRNKLKQLAVSSSNSILFHEPFGFLDYNKLQANAKCVISDSGTIGEESALLGFPAVTLRDSMERPEALESGALGFCSVGGDLVGAVRLAIDSCPPADLPAGYSVVDFSTRVVNFVISTATVAHQWRGIRKR